MSTLREELINLRERLESYLEAVSGTGIVLIDPALNILDCNQGFTRMFQLRQKPVGRSLKDFLTIGDDELNHAGELKLSCKNAAGVTGILYCYATRAESGHLLFCERLLLTESSAIEQIGIVNNELINLQRESVKKNLLLEKLRCELDERIAELEATIIERKRTEAEKAELELQNLQLQKAESLGHMAGAIAHHFNNHLGVVIGNLELVMEDLPPGSGSANYLNAAMRAAENSARMSGQMLTYLGQTSGEFAPLDISETCLQSLPILRTTMPKHVILETTLPSPGPFIRANANQMQQVLTNLVTNAWESIGDCKGTIHLDVKTVSPEEIPPLHRFPGDWQPKGKVYACIEVTDEGCGIEQRDIEKVFDPFYSTKFTGRGMGLAVVLGIVRAHRGVITVESKSKRGSIFRVYFPAEG